MLWKIPVGRTTTRQSVTSHNPPIPDFAAYDPTMTTDHHSSHFGSPSNDDIAKQFAREAKKHDSNDNVAGTISKL